MLRLKFFVNVILKIIVSVNWENIFIVRLDKERFRNNFFKLGGRNEVFFKVWIVKIFLNVVMGEKIKFNRYSENNVVLWVLVSCWILFKWNL